MPTKKLHRMLLVTLTLFTIQPAFAQEPSAPKALPAPSTPPAKSPALIDSAIHSPAQPIYGHHIYGHSYGMATHVGPGAGHFHPGAVHNGYPQQHAPMYPTPQPNIPYQVGGTYITNQAFAPHEMLWAHKYKALYPPYYYRVRGGWIVTPRGVRSHETWRLLGTEVEVKYKDHVPWTALFKPPVLR